MARDNFAKETILKLGLRVGHRCSNPDCRVPTTAASDEKNDKVNNIGIAAHISAASEGGPRYIAIFTPEQRKSIDNGIWLCSNCSIEIDKDVKKYTIEILQEWKNQAEKFAQQELGNKLPTENETIQTLTGALMGLPISFTENAIHNIHQSSSKALEAIDPRISVKTSYDENGVTQFNFYPKENITVSMRLFDNENVKKIEEKHSELIKHGKDFKIDLKDCSFDGSPLFEQIFSKKPLRLKIRSRKIKAVTKIWLEDETNKILFFDDFKGNISLGTESFSFNGFAFNKILKLSYQIFYKSKIASMKLSIDFNYWKERDIQNLPFFDKLLALFEKMSEGWMLFFALELEGKEYYRSEGAKMDDTDFVTRITYILKYTNYSKTIGKILNHKILFDPRIEFSINEFNDIFEVLKGLKAEHIYTTKDIIGNGSTTITIDDNSINDIKNTNLSETTSIRIIEKETKTIKLFNDYIVLPNKIYSFNSVLLKLNKKQDNLKIGDSLKIEFIPQENFTYTISYE